MFQSAYYDRIVELAWEADVVPIEIYLAGIEEPNASTRFAALKALAGNKEHLSETEQLFHEN